MIVPAYSLQGEGPTAVVLLHGIGGGQSIWSDDASGTARAIAAGGFCAVSVDFPGYGASASLGRVDLQGFVDAAAAVIDEVAAPHTVVLGHSMGGMVALELVAQSPQHVQGLVLACTTSAFGKPDGAWQAAFVAERLAPLDAGLGMARMAEQLVPGMVSPAAPSAALGIARSIMARVPEATYRQALQAIAGFDRRAALGAIDVPTLVLAGEDDRTAPAEVMQRMAGRIAGAQYMCLPQAGHIANLEVPAAFNEAVVGFLQRHFAHA
jgi:pimeloyl-ACP methyl ester carboxylesterase